MNEIESNAQITVVATVTCRTCGSEIPPDEATIAEALPYIVHFCGLDCYALWRASAQVVIPGLSAA